MAEQGFDVLMISSDGAEIPDLIQQESCPHLVIPFTRSITPFTDLRCLWKLTRLLRKLKPQIVHTHTPKAGLIGMWAARLAGVPVRLHTIAGLPWMESKGIMRFVLKSMERLTAMPARRVYPNSHMLNRYLQQENVGPNKMKVLGDGSSNGIDTAHFRKTAELEAEGAALREGEGVRAGACIWIFIGRIVKDKGITELVDAFKSVHEQFPEDRLWLVGQEEPELDPLDATHQEILRNHPAIKCWGFRKDVRPFLAAADVLTFPSYREGFPNVPMQAGAMGCTLLLSDINGCNEIVDHRENGLLFPVKDTDALLAAMVEVRRDPLLRKSFAEAIRRKIEQTYDQKKVWSLILKEYEELLPGHPNTSSN